MTIPRGAQLHFRTQFVVRASDGDSTLITEIVGVTRRWLSKRLDDQARLNGQWFLRGGRWSDAKRARQQVVTSALFYPEEDKVPRVWAAELQHPDDTHAFRQWGTEIGVDALPDSRLLISIATSHWLWGSYIGAELPAPELSSPRLVADILSLPGRVAFSGSQQLSLVPAIINPGDGKRLIERISDPERRVPLVYVSLPWGSREAAINVRRLNALVAGAASVFVASSSDLDKELEWLLPRNWRCWNGMVRVYQPNAKVGVEEDSGRHRFLSLTDIQQQGHDSAVSMIVRGIVRRSISLADGTILSPSDVEQREREERFRSLRNSIQGIPSKEETQMLWDEIARLEAAQKTLRVKSDEQRQKHEEDTEALEKERDSAAFQSRYWKSQADELRQKCDDLEAQAEALANLRSLPSSLREVCSRIEALHPQRLRFADEAIASAEKASFEDVGEAWALLWSIATILAPLYFEHSLTPEQIRAQFEEQSGFELALTEGRATNRDKKLMAKRVLLFEGAEYDITPHVKSRDGNRFLRVHYAIARESRRLIIGHCGDHLDTAGTRRKS